MSEGKARYRAVFVSDIHLGSVSCKSEAIQKFMQQCDCEYLYLVGDIIDMWVSRRKGKWQQSHSNVVRSILGKAKYGTKVYLTPGNHDAEFRRMNGLDFGNIFIDHQFTHTTLQDKKLLVIHGDYLDRSVTTLKPLAVMGAWLHEGMSNVNIVTNKIRTKLGKKPSDFSSNAKKRVKSFIRYFTNFEDRICVDAKNGGFDGVVCGHIHRPAFEINDEAGIMYINTGDWMDHCTAMVEHQDGRLEMLKWCPASESLQRASTSLTSAGRELL